MPPAWKLLFVWCLAVLFAVNTSFAQSASAPAATPGTMEATHLLGLGKVKRNLKGTLTIASDGLTFSSAESKEQIPTASIEDISTDQDTRETGGKAATVGKIAVPFGGGHVVSLFAHAKFDSLTIEYRDSNGGLHAAIFMLPTGQAAGAKKQLIAAGAKASTPAEETTAGDTSAAEKETP